MHIHSPAVTHADARGGEINTTTFAAANDLGIPRDYLDPDRVRRCREADDNAFEQFYLGAFLDERVQAQVPGYRAGNREIVDRAMYGERTDIATREFQRLHGKAVGGNQNFATIKRDRYRVGLHIERIVGQVVREQLLDQFAHQATAVAVRE